MRSAGIYSDDAWEQVQAVRWAILGQVLAHDNNSECGKWVCCPSGFNGFGFYGGKAHIVLKFLLEKYAAVRWPEHGERLHGLCSLERLMLCS
jgi:hypothetical protein